MIELSECILLGTILKLHGIHGQVILGLNNIRFDNILKMETVFIEIDGLPVPFFVKEYSERTTDSLQISFDDVDNEEQAKDLLGTKVYLPSDNADIMPVASTAYSQLIGYEVNDKIFGNLGVLQEIIDIQQNPLFSITDGKKEILVPASQEFILSINDESKIIYVQIPNGLIEL